MKKILITGKDSYIGTSFKEYTKNFPDKYQVEELDMMNELWKNCDFSIYDVVFHVAALVHVKERKENQNLYYTVNRDLAYEVAKKAKEETVKQFIFMSSMSVYGSEIVGKKRLINKDTALTPDNFYGDSKLQAEQKIIPLESETFKVVVVRPPMIYGKNSNGNYPKLAKLARKTSVFPNIKNERSMLYLENLTEFIKLMVDNEERGIFLPQNSEYVCSSELVREIAKIHNHKIIFTSIFNPLIYLLNRQMYINKVFGSLIIDLSLSKYKEDYNKVSFIDSLIVTERKMK